MIELVQALSQKQWTIASIESLTAGMFCAKVADVPGASEVLKGGLITYQTTSKEEVLGVEFKIINLYGVVSQECAEAMAIQGMKMFQSDIVVSCTCNAGPDVLEGKAVGQVAMAVNVKGEVCTYEEVFEGDRSSIREQVCYYLRDRIIDNIHKN